MLRYRAPSASHTLSMKPMPLIVPSGCRVSALDSCSVVVAVDGSVTVVDEPVVVVGVGTSVVGGVVVPVVATLLDVEASVVVGSPSSPQPAGPRVSDSTSATAIADTAAPEGLDLSPRSMISPLTQRDGLYFLDILLQTRLSRALYPETRLDQLRL